MIRGYNCMKKIIVLAFIFILSSLSFSAEKIELGVFSPIQLNSPETDIDGARFGLFYTKNADVKGLDINFLVSHTTGDFEGVQAVGLLNIIEGDMEGVQVFNGINVTDGYTDGYKIINFVNIDKDIRGGRIIATVNYADELDGFDLGAVNVAKKAKGIQIGFFNYAEVLDGFQVGFINVAMNSSIFPVLPLVNFNRQL
jgi:hypothetical protein